MSLVDEVCCTAPRWRARASSASRLSFSASVSSTASPPLHHLPDGGLLRAGPGFGGRALRVLLVAVHVAFFVHDAVDEVVEPAARVALCAPRALEPFLNSLRHHDPPSRRRARGHGPGAGARAGGGLAGRP